MPSPTTPISSSPSTTPTVSMMESTAPTSWKWTSSTDMPWTRASALASAMNAASDCSFTCCERVEVSSSAAISR